MHSKHPVHIFGTIVKLWKIRMEHYDLKNGCEFQENLTTRVLTLHLHMAKQQSPGINVSSESKIGANLLKLESGTR